MPSQDNGASMYYRRELSARPPKPFSDIALTYGQQTDIYALKVAISKASEALRLSDNIAETAANLLALNDLTSRLTSILKSVKLYQM